MSATGTLKTSRHACRRSSTPAREAQQEVKDVGGGTLIASVKDADGNVIGLIQAA